MSIFDEFKRQLQDCGVSSDLATDAAAILTSEAKGSDRTPQQQQIISEAFEQIERPDWEVQLNQNIEGLEFECDLDTASNRVFSDLDDLISDLFPSE